MRYLMIGTGGTGGPTAFKLASAGHPVTVIARGRHLEMIRAHGLTLRHLWDWTEENVRVDAFAEEDYDGIADVIFVCVKGYSVADIVPLIRKASDEHTVIVPVLNIYTIGETLRELIPDRYIIDGCIYVSANIDEPGVIIMHSKILRIIFGLSKGQEERPVLTALEKELNDAGIRGIYSKNIRRDALKKFSYVSPVGAAGLYCNCTAGEFVKEGEARDLCIGMMREIEALAEAMGAPFDTDVIASNCKILDNQPAETTTSMQRDIFAGGRSEIQGLVYDVPETGKQYGLDMPLYSKVAEELKRRYGD